MTRAASTPRPVQPRLCRRDVELTGNVNRDRESAIMQHDPPSQLRVSLLLAASLIAGMLASTLISPRESARRDEPLLRIEQSLAAETP